MGGMIQSIKHKTITNNHPIPPFPTFSTKGQEAQKCATRTVLGCFVMFRLLPTHRPGLCWVYATCLTLVRSTPRTIQSKASKASKGGNSWENPWTFQLNIHHLVQVPMKNSIFSTWILAFFCSHPLRKAVAVETWRPQVKSTTWSCRSSLRLSSFVGFAMFQTSQILMETNPNPI